MLEKRSVTLSGHRTSVALEPEFWAVLERASEEMEISIAGLIRSIDEARGKAGFDRPLASSLRVWALQRVSGRVPA